MYAAKFHAPIVGGRLSIDLPAGFPTGDAEVVVLIDADRSDAPSTRALADFSARLKADPRPQRSEKDFAAQIAEERAAWGDD